MASVLPTDARADYDLIVAGSGAGGLSTAVTAAILGLRVLVLEKQAQVGGTTAWSGGWMWVPRNPLARAAGIEEGPEDALDYLRHDIGSGLDEARARHYLEHAPRMVSFFQRQGVMQFVDGNAIPDFHGRNPAALQGGRSVCAAPFDGRLLGAHLSLLAPPLAETTLAGMGIASGADLRHFFQATRQWPSARHVAGRLARHAWDWVRHGRGMHLVNGNAMVAALLHAALIRGVHVRVGAPVAALLHEGRRVAGVRWGASGQHATRARHGVVLACGGFPHDPARKAALLPHARDGVEHLSAAAWGNQGDGLRLGESVGGQVARDLPEAAALAPVSRVPRRDGGFTHFPHLIERAKPGLIAVNAAGERFTNEADSYHDFMKALLADCARAGRAPKAWLVADHGFVRRYGLGAVKPAPFPLGRWIRQGYLLRGATPEALASACGIDAQGLRATLARYKRMAEAGVDEDFSKGQTPYNQVQGDRSAPWPNPCMAPLVRAPYYAVCVEPGSLGTFAGLRVDKDARVLDAHSSPIPGLYAAGNDMCSVMGGHYPSGGITLGPAMTFGYLIAHHAASQKGAESP